MVAKVRRRFSRRLIYTPSYGAPAGLNLGAQIALAAMLIVAAILSLLPTEIVLFAPLGFLVNLATVLQDAGVDALAINMMQRVFTCRRLPLAMSLCRYSHGSINLGTGALGNSVQTIEGLLKT